MPDAAYSRRTRGSARFAPYFKVQWFDERTMAWRDVQAAHATENEARAAFMPDRRCRVMAVSESGRAPLA